MEKLSNYLSKKGLTYRGFGELIGVSGVTVYNWANGLARPSWENIEKIEKVTKKKVNRNDW